MKHFLKSLIHIARQFVLRGGIRSQEQVSRFYAINQQYNQLCDRLESFFQPDRSAGYTPSGYDWDLFRKQVRNSFKSGVPIDFLLQPLIKETMVYRTGDVTPLTNFVYEVYSEENSSSLLHEDYIGLPEIINYHTKTSANRALHAYHLAFYFKKMGVRFDGDTIVEWGGGYGNMARLITKINHKVTYIIVDLPEFSALQYIYLSSVLGHGRVHFVSDERDIEPERVNVITSMAVINGAVELSCDAFISTWALTESPKEYQEFVIEEDFFQADKILLAYCQDAQNKVNKIPGFPSSQGFKCFSVAPYNENHRYALR